MKAMFERPMSSAWDVQNTSGLSIRPAGAPERLLSAPGHSRTVPQAARSFGSPRTISHTGWPNLSGPCAEPERALCRT
eukprot:scaffold24104_cov61-Phaeocystis_antarctica.AAC.7